MTPPATARLSAGLSIAEAARRGGIGAIYLTRLEKRGRFPYVLAVRMARIYCCSVDIFI